MSRIEQLIAERCPNGVPIRTVAEFTRESTIRNRQRLPLSVRSVTNSSGLVPTSELFDTSRTSSDTKNYKVVHPGMFVYNPSRINVGSISWHKEATAVIVSPMYIVFEVDSSVILPEYLLLLLESRSGKNQIASRTEVGARFRLTYSSLSLMSFAVPPIETQREIARILNRFTELEAELEAELKARREQSEYYLRQLLLFAPNGAREMTLRDIGRVATCKRIFKSETRSTGEVPFFKIGTFGGEPDAFISRKLFDDYRAKYSFPNPGDVLISAAGTIGRTVTYGGEAEYFQDSNIVWLDHDESIVSNAYLKHWYRIVEWETDGGTIKRLYNANLLRAKISVPPKDEQARIVERLDKFDALVSDLHIGLPAELAARRRQYEYYRERLITFERVPA